MEFQEKKILIMGAGLSGIAAAQLLDGTAELVLYDANTARNEEEIRAKLPESFRGRIVLGVLPEEVRFSSIKQLLFHRSSTISCLVHRSFFIRQARIRASFFVSSAVCSP